MKSHRVKKTDVAAYPDPILLSVGEAIEIGEEDSEFPGWVWCTNADGKSGWVPVDCADRQSGRARYAYSARELSAEKGEEVTIDKVENGWAWTSKADGEEGWIPVANLEALR